MKINWATNVTVLALLFAIIVMAVVACVPPSDSEYTFLGGYNNGEVITPEQRMEDGYPVSDVTRIVDTKYMVVCYLYGGSISCVKP